MTEIETPHCFLCATSQAKEDLIEIQSNSLEYGEETVEFAELFHKVLDLKVCFSLLIHNNSWFIYASSF